jgi:hypothetical protein
MENHGLHGHHVQTPVVVDGFLRTFCVKYYFILQNEAYFLMVVILLRRKEAV